MIPEPEILRRSWTFAYARPKQMGWPLLTMQAIPAGTNAEGGRYPGRKAKRIIPKRIRIVVRQAGQAQPHVESVSVTGNWMSSGQEAIGIKVHFDAGPGYFMIVYADENVRELMADAVHRAAAENAPLSPQEQT